MTTREAYWRAVYDKRNFLTDQGTQNWVLGPSRKSLPTNVPDEPKLINVNSLR